MAIAIRSDGQCTDSAAIALRRCGLTRGMSLTHNTAGRELAPRASRPGGPGGFRSQNFGVSQNLRVHYFPLRAQGKNQEAWR